MFNLYKTDDDVMCGNDALWFTWLISFNARNQNAVFPITLYNGFKTGKKKFY